MNRARQDRKGRRKNGVHAPYNFVPLAKQVVFPDWADLVSHDVPFEDGCIGSIEVELTAITPICVGSGATDKKGTVLPFRLPDGTYAIPGTAIKGMLRNVVEIASFSKMSLVDRDRRFAVRDLSKGGEFYRKEITKVVESNGKKNVYASTVRTGWLEQRGGKWVVIPCKMSRVEQEDILQAIHGSAKKKLLACFTGTKFPARKKYEAIGESNLTIRFTPEEEDEHPMSNGKGALWFSKATDLGTGGTAGTLVFTGQPTPNSRLKGDRESGRKHREFIFYDDDPTTELEVDKIVMRNFRLNHSKDQGERHAGGDPEPNEEWKFWREKLKKGHRVPVFFLEKGGHVDSLGLAQMYRLAYKHSIGDAIDAATRDHDPASGKMDLADLVFGQVAADEAGSSLKGRVSVTLFEAQGKPELTPEYKGILNGPKPTYYPSYIEQEKGAPAYKTFMDEDATIRGWKRYPVRRQIRKPDAPSREQENVTSRWRCLKEGTIFRGRIVIHNLRPVELGALLWAIDFGGKHNLCHSLGKAKPFGFGAVSLRVTSADLRKTRDLSTWSATKEAVRAFTDYMEAHVGKWESTPQIKNLLDMANPALGKERAEWLEYMVLGRRKDTNEFQKAKNSHHFLPPYSDIANPTAYQIDPSSQEKRGQNRQNSSAAPHSESVDLVKSGETVTATLLKEKTNKGGWKAEYAGFTGHIMRWKEMPSHLKPGDQVLLKVRSSNTRRKSIDFEWVDQQEK